MSKMEASNYISSGSFNQCFDKLVKMREFIETVKEYIRIKTEKSALIIQRWLQAYGTTTDLHIFDPDSVVGSQFYVSLYELFGTIEPQSLTAWECVNVLTNACRNNSAREALINTYQFLPMLSRMLNQHLSNEKRKKLLRLLQDITSGIKLSWQLPDLPHLFAMLTEWIKDDDPEITCLSLGVLVNVCYKNLPAQYTLSRIVDVKRFLRHCLLLKGSLVEVHVCKLMIIMDHCHEELPKKTLLSLIEPTFSSILESFAKNDHVMLRTVVDFFIDMICQENPSVFKEYQHYNEQLSKLLQILNEKNSCNLSNFIQPDADCANILLKFIYTLEIQKLGNLSSLYPDVIKLALDWVQSEKVSCQALLILIVTTQNSIKIDNVRMDNDTLEILTDKLPVFVSFLNVEITSLNLEGYKRTGCILNLLRIMLTSKSICNRVLNSIDENLLRHVFSPILRNDFTQINLPIVRFEVNSTTSTEVIDMYIFALGLVNELSQHDVRWLEMLSVLMENKIVHEIMAYALYGSCENVKQLVLELSKYPRFPIQKVSNAMSTLQNIFVSHSKPTANPFLQDGICPGITVPQITTLDETLSKFKRLIEQEPDPSNIPTKKVMELYEYKIASLVQSESFALNSIRASSEQCAHLQQRLAQLTEEHNKLRQVMYQSEVKLARKTEAVEEMRRSNLEKIKENDRELAKKDRIVKEFEEKLKNEKLKLLEMAEEKSALESQITKYEQMIKKLEDCGQRYDKELKKCEEKLKNANVHIDKLNQQNQDLQKILSQKEAKLEDLMKQSNAMKEVMSHITKMASSQLPELH